MRQLDVFLLISSAGLPVFLLTSVFALASLKIDVEIESTSSRTVKNEKSIVD